MTANDWTIFISNSAVQILAHTWISLIVLSSAGYIYCISRNFDSGRFTVTEMNFHGHSVSLAVTPFDRYMYMWFPIFIFLLSIHFAVPFMCVLCVCFSEVSLSHLNKIFTVTTTAIVYRNYVIYRIISRPFTTFLKWNQLLVVNRKFFMHLLYLTPSSREISSEFYRVVWYEKIRIVALLQTFKSIAKRFSKGE